MKILKVAQDTVMKLLAEDPRLEKEENLYLKKYIQEKFNKIEL